MLKFLIAVTRDAITASILIGLLYAYIPDLSEKRGRKGLSVGVLAGIAGALLIAFLKNATKVIDDHGGMNMWNVYIFAASTILLLLFFGFIRGKRKDDKKESMSGVVIAGALACTLLLYALPSVLGYPANFNLNGASILSTAFLYRLMGYLFGVLLCLLTGISASNAGARADRRTLKMLLTAALLINAFQQICKGLQVLHARRLVSGSFIFGLIRFTSNNGDLFIYAVMVIAVIIPLLLWARSFSVNEPYENPAQHRKILAKWRSIRRWATALILCFLMAVTNLTVFAAIDGREVELSPTEECEVREDAVYVSLSQVDDGHLHRFAYTTENGVAVRFIIIKKPGASSYGVGLDACDICGETGYYERNGQVVCNLCDVVMNINTIGFKGGCNPIVIDYSIEEGYITIPISGLTEHEKEFK